MNKTRSLISSLMVGAMLYLNQGKLSAIELRPCSKINEEQRKEIEQIIEETSSKFEDQEQDYAKFCASNFKKETIYVIFKDLSYEKPREGVEAKLEVNNIGVINLFLDYSLLDEWNIDKEWAKANLSASLIEEFTKINYILEDPKGPFRENRMTYQRFKSRIENASGAKRDSLLMQYNLDAREIDKKTKEYMESIGVNVELANRIPENVARYAKEKYKQTKHRRYKEIRDAAKRAINVGY